jgi:putative FmdB family regulatory protein
MPTYEYECLSCGHNFEASQKMTDKHINKCPECGKKVRRLIGSGAGIIFKGSGFYATDYRKQPKSKDPKESQKNVCPKAKEGCSGCQ